ncbi:redoxin domain-containing protein [Lolliginicoccus suaedae]|uniref:redoxin domain-containing protein n=1 Tax=Lolliginicoccus suaedae TaxID=2605429 RepID=UPI0011EF9338|nr:redoxin domain-containing protein [Lolliginicoccus suaedae]
MSLPRRWNPRFASLSALTAASALALGACGSSTTEPQAAAPAAPESVSVDGQEVEVPNELRFAAETLEGQPVNGSDYLGQDTVFWFWAPWCPVCQREAPHVADAAEDYGSEVDFVGVAAQDSAEAMQEFVDKYDVGAFSHINDANAAVWAGFGVTQQPAFAFVSDSGEIDVVRGTLSPDELTERLDTLTRN